MIETKMQAKQALEEIMSKTGWSQREIAKRAAINNATVGRILRAARPDERPPVEGTRKAIRTLLSKVRKMK